MKPTTELFLYQLSWMVEGWISYPRMSRIGESFEGWAYRNGLMPRLAYLEKCQLIERQPGPSVASRIYRLTSKGHRRVLGGRDPVERWNRAWDGLWRMVFYDVPETEHVARDQLREYLAGEHFGLIQRSVMITPDFVGDTSVQLA